MAEEIILGGQLYPTLGFFQNCLFQSDGIDPRFFFTFKCIIRHIFTDNFIEIPQSRFGRHENFIGQH